MYIDTHAHLMFSDFEEDLEKILIRAKNSGVRKIINVTCNPNSLEKSLTIIEKFSGGKLKTESNKFPKLYATIGLHPYDSDKYTPELFQKWEKIIEEDKNSQNPKIVAIGETGLDYFKCKISQEIQKKSLEAHFKLAVKYQLPIILHNRESDQDILNFLEKFSKEGKLKAVVHCFDSILEVAKKIWELGHMTSFTGLITYPKNDRIREVIKNSPLNQIMIETDAPYLAPQNHRGKRNEPSFILETAEKIAEIKNLKLEELNLKIQENSIKFFNL